MRFFATITLLASAAVAAADTGIIADLSKYTTAGGAFTVNTLITVASLPSQKAVLDTLANAAGPITLFAPTDDAFAKVIAAGFNSSDVAALTDVLLYHVAPTAFVPSAAREFIDTARPNPANGGKPTKLRSDLNSTSKAVTLTFGLSSAKVIQTDHVTLTGGGAAVIHFIDAVLVPPTTAAATASNVPSLSSLVAALKTANLVDAVTSASGITILAPVNDAFTAIASTAATLTTAQLASVLTFHVIPGVFYSTDLVKAGPTLANIPTLFAGNNLTETNDGTTVQISGAGNTSPAKVVITDVLVANGVVHVIDTVLLPKLSNLPTGSASATATSTAATASPTSLKAGAAKVAPAGLAAAAVAAVAAIVF
ncbi:FAS1 domain-containing protein [Zopfochytrium polystomum]|nr:FAS1 domain-containing protein [Zopfochytrium polystomum]